MVFIENYQCYSYYLTILFTLFNALEYVFSFKNEISCTCDTRHLNTHLGHKNVVLAV